MKRRLMVIGLLVLALFQSSGSGVLAGGTWYVDGVHGSDDNDCRSPNFACKTIGHAISLASSGDTIVLAKGIYTENLIIPFSLVIVGSGAESTIIDGGKKDTVFDIPNASTDFEFSRATVENGLANSNGAGISNMGRVTLNLVAIVSNETQGIYPNIYGGGIYNHGRLTISNSIIQHNTAPNGYGGGIFNDGTLTINTSVLGENRTTAYGGGGGIANNGTVTIDGATISGNNSQNFAGGIWNEGGILAINNSTFSRNSARYNGGAIYNDGTLTTATLAIHRSTFLGNITSGGGGGAIFNLNGTVTMYNSTVNRNAALSGGGISNQSSLTIANSTVSGNGAHYGGDIANIGSTGAIVLQNSIVANSISGSNCYVDEGSILSNGYNLSSDGSCPFTNIGDLINANPRLGPLRNNGGTTETLALLLGSPAIDAGNPGPNDGKGTDCLPADQCLRLRINRCDMGAYEYP